MATNTEMIHEIATSVALIKETVVRLDKAVMGNGKPGLIDRVRDIESRHKNEDDDHREVKERKDKVGAKTWAVILVFITQAVGLVVLFIRTGNIR